MGQVEIDGKITDKWSFEIWISELGSGDVKFSDKIKLNPPIFNSKEEALQGLKSAVKLASEVLCNATGADPDKFIDMKTNELRGWKDTH